MSERRRVLFVCGRNQRRSPTAAAIFRNDPGIEARSAGVSESSRHQINASDVAWADVILAFEGKHRQRIVRMFPDAEGKTLHLDISDDYEFMDADLVEELLHVVPDALRTSA
ncbi:MAG TPA: protein-tyrosine-phosphatase [Chthoniobacterales bacterium]